jgi:hypothetical protein
MSDTIDTITCPKCQGAGLDFGWGDKFTSDATMQGGPAVIPCPQCKGAKTVPAEMIGWIVKGEQLREARIARRETLRDAALRLGIPAVVLSEAERGVIDPDTVKGLDA